MELKRRAQSLCEQKDLQGEKRKEVQQTVKDTEQQLRTVLKDAEDTQRYRKLFYLLRGNLIFVFFPFYMSVTVLAQLQLTEACYPVSALCGCRHLSKQYTKVLPSGRVWV